jgi:phospholipid/cholesterol/gamma-HCH transport system permease protein
VLAEVERLDRVLGALPSPAPGKPVRMDLADVIALDTAGAWLVTRTAALWRQGGNEVEVAGAPAALSGILEEVSRIPPETPVRAREGSPLIAIVDHVGASTIGLGRDAVELVNFLGLIVTRLGRLIARPSHLRVTSLVVHMEETGLKALPIVGLLSFLIGVVLAYQGADQLRQFGAEIFVVNLLGISILRELGILITAIIVAGRSGSAFTAQIGTMKVNQEIDALQTLGLDPVDVLVLPRILALMVTLPLLAFYADLVGLAGGAVMAWAMLDIPFGTFMRQLQSAVSVTHFWIGLLKAPVFAFTIAMVGCLSGMKVTGSAESVGRLTTSSVVKSIFLVIVLDALFSIAFARLGV